MNYEYYLSPEEASKYLRVSLSTVHDLMKQNELAANKDDGNWIISRSDKGRAARLKNSFRDILLTMHNAPGSL